MIRVLFDIGPVNKENTDMIIGSFGDQTVNKSRNYVLTILLGAFRDQSVKNQRMIAETMC